MPIRKDDAGNRWIEMELLVPGTPEQVWDAMATGPGNSAWFTKATIDGRPGGAMEFDFGAIGKSAGEVTVWEPPHRFGYIEREWSEGAPPVATEITITSRSGDRCVVRMVHSLFSTTDDWDDQMEGFEKGWPGFFEVLRIYLAHFAGRPAASYGAMATTEGEHLAVWKRLVDRLGLAGADVGERRTTLGQPEELSGVIERVEQGREHRYILMRLEAGVALLGTFPAGPGLTGTSVSLYAYGDDAAARAAAAEPLWREWVSA